MKLGTGSLLMLSIVCGPARCAEPIAELSGELGPGISYSIREGSRPGPTVLVVAGSRSPGAHLKLVIRQVRNWAITGGKLILLTVDAAGPLIFSGETTGARGSPEQMIWDFVVKNRPGWLVELDEGDLYAQAGKGARGGSLFHDGSRQGAAIAAAMVAGVNESIEVDDNRFTPRPGSSPGGSLALLAVRRLEARTMSPVVSVHQNVLTEGSTHRQQGKYFPVRVVTRIRHHRMILHRLLLELKVIGDSVNVHQLAPSPGGGKVRRDSPLYMAVFDGYGTGAPRAFGEWLKSYPFVEMHPIGTLEIKAAGLESFHVIVFPGGEAMEQWPALGVAGRLAIRKFVRSGGGYIGICAGAYMTAQYPKYRWGLGLLDADILDHDHYARGVGMVKIELTDTGREALSEPRKSLLDLHYGNGPLFVPAGKEGIPDYRTFAYYRTAIARGEAKSETMIDTPAIIAGAYGRGRVIASSGHTGWSTGLEDFFPRFVLWTGRREGVARPVAQKAEAAGK